MAYDTIFARSFSRHEQKKLGFGAFIGFMIIAFCFCTIYKPYITPLPILNLRLTMGVSLKMLMATDEKILPVNLPIIKIEERANIICNFSEPRSDYCNMSGDIRIHGNSSTIFIADTIQNNSWSIKPYARKMDKTAMGYVKSITIKTENLLLTKMPSCTKNCTVPAVVFSIGGFTGNHFHDFTDVLIPLYITSREFNGEVQFLVTDKDSWWIKKFKKIMENLSNYEVIHLVTDEGVHCFKKMIVGLRGHKELGIDPQKSIYSMKDFRAFLRKSYSLKKEVAIKLRPNLGIKPRILIISRKRSRSFVNEDEIADMARDVGYEVVLTEANEKMVNFSRLVNSCDVVMGVHGAGLTNIVFMPENGVVIQVVPWGAMQWIATTAFGDPSKDMNLKYLEYEIREEESSLVQEYPLEHEVFRDPFAIAKKGWGPFKEMYLVKQNVKLNVTRFRATLVKALELLQV